jgi:HAD superfamily hydrolase (TIGR01450 family)
VPGSPSASTLVTARAWVFDVDGCLVRTSSAGGVGGAPFPGAVDLVAALKAAGRRVLLCTNASARPPARYAAHLRGLGFAVTDEEVVTAGSATADTVATRHPGARVLVLGSDGITAPLGERGVAVVDAADGGTADVVVVGAADGYSAEELNAACLAVEAGAPFYVTVATPWFSGGGERSVCTSSAVAAAVSWVTGVPAEVTGKPSAALGARLLARLGHRPADVVVVGDHSAEIELARAMGAGSVLVLSGATSREGLGALPAGAGPDLVFPAVRCVHDLVRPHLGEAASRP